MVRFTLYLEIIENENLLENANKMGKELGDQLIKLQKKHPNLISNARNRGLFGAFDFPDPETRDKVNDMILEEGTMMLGCGTKTIRFRPHLNISKSELEDGFSMIDNALGRFQKS